MNEQLDVFKAEAIKGIANSADCRMLMVEGKTVFAEKFSSPVPAEPASSANNTLLIGAIAVFSCGVVAGAWFQRGQDAAKIQRLTAENLILESKISKIRDLVK